MIIGLVSDTHIARTEDGLPRRVVKALRGVDLILHAGDIWIPWVLDELAAIAPVLAAKGDDDVTEDFNGDPRVREKLELNYEGVSIWVSHVKPPNGMINSDGESRLLARMLGRHEKPLERLKVPDVVVFGHTHRAVIDNFKGSTLVNPGSPTMPRHVPGNGTIGILSVENGLAQARIVPLD